MFQINDRVIHIPLSANEDMYHESCSRGTVAEVTSNHIKITLDNSNPFDPPENVPVEELILDPYPTLQLLFSDKSRWTKNYFGLYKDGQTSCVAKDPRAYSFCLAGGIQRCYPNTQEKYLKLVREYLKVHSETDPKTLNLYHLIPIMDYNNSDTGYEDVVKLVKELNI